MHTLYSLLYIFHSTLPGAVSLNLVLDILEVGGETFTCCLELRSEVLSANKRQKPNENLFIVVYVSMWCTHVEHLYSLNPSFSLESSVKAGLCIAGLNCFLFSQVGQYGFESLPTTL